jgi:hypothetical protein
LGFCKAFLYKSLLLLLYRRHYVNV